MYTENDYENNDFDEYNVDEENTYEESSWDRNKGLIIKVIIIVLCVLILIWLISKLGKKKEVPSNELYGYSLNKENGGLVTTISASFKNSIHSLDLKSPSPFKSCKTLFLFFINNSTSAKSTAPSLL